MSRLFIPSLKNWGFQVAPKPGETWGFHVAPKIWGFRPALKIWGFQVAPKPGETWGFHVAPKIWGVRPAQTFRGFQVVPRRPSPGKLGVSMSRHDRNRRRLILGFPSRAQAWGNLGFPCRATTETGGAQACWDSGFPCRAPAPKPGKLGVSMSRP